MTEEMPNDHGAKDLSGDASLVLRYQSAVERNDKIDINVRDLDQIIGSVSLLAFTVDIITELLQDKFSQKDDKYYLINLAAERARYVSQNMSALGVDLMKRVSDA